MFFKCGLTHTHTHTHTHTFFYSNRWHTRQCTLPRRHADLLITSVEYVYNSELIWIVYFHLQPYILSRNILNKMNSSDYSYFSDKERYSNLWIYSIHPLPLFVNEISHYVVYLHVICFLTWNVKKMRYLWMEANSWRSKFMRRKYRFIRQIWEQAKLDILEVLMNVHMNEIYKKLTTIK